MKTISLETKIILDYISITRSSYFSVSSDDYLKENSITFADTEKTVEPISEKEWDEFYESDNSQYIEDFERKVLTMLKSRGLVV